MDPFEALFYCVCGLIACAMFSGWCIGSAHALPQPKYLHRNLLGFALIIPITILFVMALAFAHKL